jgi:hypothetical protein
MVTVCETNDIKTHSDESGRNVESDAPGVVEPLAALLETANLSTRNTNEE